MVKSGGCELHAPRPSAPDREHGWRSSVAAALQTMRHGNTGGGSGTPLEQIQPRPAAVALHHAPDREHGWRSSVAAALQTMRHGNPGGKRYQDDGAITSNDVSY
jgi:hypothetical protein